MSLPKDAYLAHHGILGQKWGKRNGPPYPLGASDHSASEKKAGWKDSLSSYGKSDSGKNKLVNWAKNQDLDEIKEAREKKSSDKSEAASTAALLALGVATLNPFLIAAETTRLVQAGSAAKKAKESEARKANLEVDKKTGLRLKDKDYTQEEDQKMVNPEVWNFDKNTKNNCMLCTTAYELRRRGYDVTAGKAVSGYGSEELKDFFPKAKVEDLYFPETDKELKRSSARASLGMNKELTRAVVDGLKKQGDGARGNLMVKFDTLAGHSVAYEIENGELVIRDCQVNKTFRENPKAGSGKAMKIERLLNSCSTAECVRTDNLEFDKDKIKEAVR